MTDKCTFQIAPKGGGTGLQIRHHLQSVLWGRLAVNIELCQFLGSPEPLKAMDSNCTFSRGTGDGGEGGT